MSTTQKAEKTPAYTASISVIHLLDENSYYITIYDHDGKTISRGHAHYEWTAKFKAWRLIRLAQKGIVFAR